jgi:cell division protein FtsB
MDIILEIAAGLKLASDISTLAQQLLQQHANNQPITEEQAAEFRKLAKLEEQAAGDELDQAHNA